MPLQSPTRRPGAAVLLAAGLLLTGADYALAHGDLHEQIAAVSAQIEKEPLNADLFLKRAELHRLHAEFPEAAADLARAEALRPSSPELNLAKARLAFSTGKPEAAIATISEFLRAHPDYPEAWMIRARARAALGQHAGAVSDFSEIVKRVDRPEPDVFIERAMQITSFGDAHLDEAISSLEEGLKKLGPVITLDLAALDLELKLKRYDAALARIDRLSAPAQRKESWLARRGDILLLAGRTDEARSAYQAAKAAITILPPQHRTNRATLDLEERVSAALAKLDADAKK